MKLSFIGWSFISAGLFLGGVAEARVFSFKERGVAPYVRGSFGYSQLQDDAFADSSGANTSLNGTVPWNYGGELGLALGWTDAFFTRFGAEIISGSNGHITGTSASGVDWFTLDSRVFVFNPNITFEYFYSQGQSARFFVAGSVGMASVTLENRYVMTSAGQTALSKPSFNEKATANTICGALSAGLEFLFTDNVTMMLDLGYRYLPVNELKLTGPVNSIAQPAGAEGDTLKNSDGSARKLNMGGFYTSLAFRFYIW